MQPARFGQYLVRFEPGGGTREPLAGDREHFLYVLEGGRSGRDRRLEEGGYAYLPPDESRSISARRTARSSSGSIARTSPPRASPSRPPCSGNREDEPFAETATPGVRRRELLPVDEPAATSR